MIKPIYSEIFSLFFIHHNSQNFQNFHASIIFLIKIITFMISNEFRFCNKCFTNQVRVAHSSSDKIDWRIVELSKEQLREKKLKDLGI